MKQYILSILVIFAFCLTLLPAFSGEFDEKKINVYPNPVVKGTPLTVEILAVEHGERTVILYNTVGKEIYKLNTTDKTVEFNAPNVSGIYLLRIIEKQKVVAVEKIVVKE